MDHGPLVDSGGRRVCLQEEHGMQWYVSQKGKTSGPFDEQRLAMLVQWGKVSRDAFICDKQLSAWIAIKRSGFAPLLPAAPARGRSAEAPGARPLHRATARVAGGLELPGDGLDIRGRLGIFALSVLIAGLLMTALCS
jgi:hypothetical protein